MSRNLLPDARASRRRSRVPRNGQPSRKDRRGMTLVELLVAVMLISVGLVALAGVAGGVSKLMRGGDAQTTTAMAVQTSLEQLSVTGRCRDLVAVGATRDSTVVIQGVTIHKRLEGLHNVIYVRDSVNMPGRTQPLVYRSMLPCRN
jgi:prepilin-type N-terminal cleavage/methylation domain-containing protein